MRFSSSAVLLGLLASVPIVAGLAHVGSPASNAVNAVRELFTRHHTEAQIEAKEAAEAKKHQARDAQEPDEFGPWDSTEDEYGSWVDKREPSPHHTEAQIAAKEAAAKAASAPATSATPCAKGKSRRSAHHTEAQIEAKEAAAANACSD